MNTHGSLAEGSWAELEPLIHDVLQTEEIADPGNQNHTLKKESIVEFDTAQAWLHKAGELYNQHGFKGASACFRHLCKSLNIDVLDVSSDSQEVPCLKNLGESATITRKDLRLTLAGVHRVLGRYANVLKERQRVANENVPVEERVKRSA